MLYVYIYIKYIHTYRYIYIYIYYILCAEIMEGFTRIYGVKACHLTLIEGLSKRYLGQVRAATVRRASSVWRKQYSSFHCLFYSYIYLFVQLLQIVNNTHQ